RSTESRGRGRWSGRGQVGHARVDRIVRLGVDSGRGPGGRARPAVGVGVDAGLALEMGALPARGRVPLLDAGNVSRRALFALSEPDPDVGDQPLLLRFAEQLSH